MQRRHRSGRVASPLWLRALRGARWPSRTVQKPPRPYVTTRGPPSAITAAVAGSTEKIETLLRRLERSGAEPTRLDALRTAQQFKRSWVELAGKLVEIRRDRSYEAWGYDDFHRYCAEELHLRRGTVDKLTISFSTLERVAPQVLSWDGVAKTIPSYEAIDYLGKAMRLPPEDAAASRKREEPAPPREVIKELRQAVFDEGQTVGELRKRFDPVLWPKPKGADELEMLQRASTLAKKLVEVLSEIDGLQDRRVAAVEQVLGALRQDLEGLAEPLRAKVERKRKAAPPPPAGPTGRAAQKN